MNSAIAMRFRCYRRSQLKRNCLLSGTLIPGDCRYSEIGAVGPDSFGWNCRNSCVPDAQSASPWEMELSRNCSLLMRMRLNNIDLPHARLQRIRGLPIPRSARSDIDRTIRPEDPQKAMWHPCPQ